MLSDSFQHVSFHCSLIWGCAKRYHSYMYMYQNQVPTGEQSWRKVPIDNACTQGFLANSLLQLFHPCIVLNAEGSSEFMQHLTAKNPISYDQSSSSREVQAIIIIDT